MMELGPSIQDGTSKVRDLVQRAGGGGELAKVEPVVDEYMKKYGDEEPEAWGELAKFKKQEIYKDWIAAKRRDVDRVFDSFDDRDWKRIQMGQDISKILTDKGEDELAGSLAMSYQLQLPNIFTDWLQMHTDTWDKGSRPGNIPFVGDDAPEIEAVTKKAYKDFWNEMGPTGQRVLRLAPTPGIGGKNIDKMANFYGLARNQYDPEVNKSIDKYSTKQLRLLSNRPEVDAALKADIMKELAKRDTVEGLRPLYARNSPIPLAERKKELAQFRKEGGYVPRGNREKMDQPPSWDQSWKKSVEENKYDKFVRTFKAAGAVEDAKDINYKKPEVSYNSVTGDIQLRSYVVPEAGKSHKVDLGVRSDGYVDWKVDYSYDKGSTGASQMDSSTRREIANKARQSWDVVLRALPPGTVLSTSAYTGDDSGESRVRAYKTMGFGDPKEGETGRKQYGIVTKLGFKPLDPDSDEAFESDEQFLFDYSEGEEEDIIKAFEIVLFG